MLFVRFRPLIIIVSLLFSVGLWAVGVFLIPEGQQGKFAVLVFDESVPDRQVRSSLEQNGFSGVISESGEHVFLDNFNGIEQVPLDGYDRRVLSFDPRNDGYAEKLRSLFVRDGKRYAYIPVVLAKSGSFGERLAGAMGETPYSLESLAPPARSGIPHWLLLAMFAAASCALLLIRPLRQAIRPDFAFFLPCLPALAPLALAGAAGFALAAVLAGFAVLAAEACLEQFGAEYGKFSGRQPRPSAFLPILFIALIIAASAATVIILDVPVVLALAVFHLLCGILALLLWGASFRKGAYFAWTSRRSRRFSPVPILSRKLPMVKPAGALGFSWVMLPFAVIALALALADIAFPAIPATGAASPHSIPLTEADYRSHYQFQKTFSNRSLHEPSFHDFPFASMSSYGLAPDGLPVEIAVVSFNDATDMPPFTLGALLQEMSSAGQSTGRISSRSRVSAHNLWMFFLPAVFLIPAFIGSRIRLRHEIVLQGIVFYRLFS